MLIVCPSCASEYMIDPGRLGAEGRTVRCAKCKETWFVIPDPAEPVLSTGDNSPDIPGTPDPQDAETTEAWEQFSSAPAEAEEAKAYPASEAGDGLRAATRANSPRASRGIAASGALLIVATLTIAGSAFWGRAHVVRTFPAMATLYAGIGLPVNLRGLEFRAVRSELVGSGADTFLVVEGEIANISGRDAPVPPIEIAVRGAEGQMLYTWTNDPPRDIMAVSDTAHFRARLAAPPVEGRQVLVRFATGRDSAAFASHMR